MVALPANSAPRTVTMRPMSRVQLNAHVQKMIKLALEQGLAAEVERIEYGLYLIPSASRGGLVHTVTGTGPQMECTCEAGQFMPFCRHRAAVAIRRLHEQGLTVEVGADGVAQGVKRTRVEDLVFPPKKYPHLVKEA